MAFTPYAFVLVFLTWLGIPALLWSVGAHLYVKAEYNAWGADNVDKRLFFAGTCVGFATAWFLLKSPG